MKQLNKLNKHAEIIGSVFIGGQFNKKKTFFFHILRRGDGGVNKLKYCKPIIIHRHYWKNKRLHLIKNKFSEQLTIDHLYLFIAVRKNVVSRRSLLIFHLLLACAQQFVYSRCILITGNQKHFTCWGTSTMCC